MSLLQPEYGILHIGDREFSTLTEYLHQNFGIDLRKKRELVESRLNNYLSHNGYDDYATFLGALFSDTTGSEVNTVINYLTTNYSYFMREFDSIRFFRDEILPKMKNNIRDRDLRIWSAGCSTGEEPYSIAMVNADFFGDQKGLWDQKILATDISEKVLNKAKLGVYDAQAFEKVPTPWKNQYFEKLAEGACRVRQEIKNEIIFRKFNLMETQFPFKRKFHVILCRNVMIYFDAPTKQALVEKFYENTENGGYLIIGQSESIDRSRTSYKFVKPSIFVKGE
jgi:chemotaxis protein methyltransferase CheR